MGRAVRGRRLSICCCAFCRHWSLRIWGAGEGLLSELLARRCMKRSLPLIIQEKIVAFGKAKAKKNGSEEPGISTGRFTRTRRLSRSSVDLIGCPEPGAASCGDSGRGDCDRLQNFEERPGQIAVLDLLKHSFEQAHELYGDRRLGFARERFASLAGKRRFQRRLKSASSRGRNSRRTFRRFWRARKSDRSCPLKQI